jgi:hypothetical protein
MREQHVDSTLSFVKESFLLYEGKYIMPIFNGFLQKIDIAETRRYAGLRAAENFSDKIVADACTTALAIAKPRGIFQQCGYDAESYQLLCEEPFTVEGSKIRKHLENAKIAIIMAVTIGSDIEKEINTLFSKKEYSRGLMLDAAAITATETIADQLNHYIDKMAAKQGYETTWRYSPGYGDWPLTQQLNLIKAIHADQIDIHITSGCMLVPQKSITAIIGMARSAAKNSIPSGCCNCSMHNICSSRKE